MKLNTWNDAEIDTQIHAEKFSASVRETIIRVDPR